MEIIIRRRDIYIVAVALSLFFSWVAYATYENFDARTTLRDMAEVHIDEWFDSEPGGTNRDDYEYLAIVDMERPYELFGPAFGVVHVYIRDKGDEACKTFKGIEYYYRMGESGWHLEHSAGCAAKQHHIRAFQSYIEQGSGVHYTAIDEALGIEFDVARAEEYLKARQEGRNPFLAGHAHDHDGHEHGLHDLKHDERAADAHNHKSPGANVHEPHQEHSSPDVKAHEPSPDHGAAAKPRAIDTTRANPQPESPLLERYERRRAERRAQNAEVSNEEGVSP